MSHLSKRAIDLLLSHKRNLDLEDEDPQWRAAFEAVAWAYLVAREACDEAERGAADAAAAKSDYDAESAGSEPSTDVHERALGGTNKADRALFAAAAALNDATSTLEAHRQHRRRQDLRLQRGGGDPRPHRRERPRRALGGGVGLGGQLRNSRLPSRCAAASAHRPLAQPLNRRLPPLRRSPHPRHSCARRNPAEPPFLVHALDAQRPSSAAPGGAGALRTSDSHETVWIPACAGMTG